jgi:hypothetical protein
MPIKMLQVIFNLGIREFENIRKIIKGCNSKNPKHILPVFKLMYQTLHFDSNRDIFIFIFQEEMRTGWG